MAGRRRTGCKGRCAGWRYPGGSERPAGERPGRSFRRARQRYRRPGGRLRGLARRAPGVGQGDGRGEEVIRVQLDISSPALRAGLRALLSSDDTIKIVNDSLEDDSEADVVIMSAS